MFKTYLENINIELSKKLKRLAAFEQHGYKRLAYSRAATSIANLKQPIDQIVDKSSIEGVGKSIAKKIDQFLSTGEIKKLAQRERTAAKKTNIVRIQRNEAIKKVRPLLDKAQGLKFEVCGSIRRGENLVKDVDILALQSEMPRWYEIIDSLDIEGINRGAVSTDFKLNGIAVNIRAVQKSTWGAGLLFLTGPQMFNINLRSQAKKKGMLLNQYGIFDRVTNKRIAGRTEESIFRALGISYIDPNRR